MGGVVEFIRDIFSILCNLREGHVSWMSSRDYTSLEGTKDPSQDIL